MRFICQCPDCGEVYGGTLVSDKQWWSSRHQDISCHYCGTGSESFLPYEGEEVETAEVLLTTSFLDNQELHLLDRVLFIDIEASGLGIDSYPIECGWTVWNGEGDATLINHQPWLESSYWDSQAELLHGISKESLKDAPDAKTALKIITDKTQEGILFSDCPKMESIWLSLLSSASQDRMKWTIHDATSLFGKSLKDERMANSIMEKFKTTGHHHRAQGDSLVLWKVWQVCLNVMGGEICNNIIREILKSQYGQSE